jgi:hypothetical protein
MSRNRLLLVATALTIASLSCLAFGISLLHKDIRWYIAAHYREYSQDAGGTRYACDGSPAQVADTLAGYQDPEARAGSAGTQYLRYDDAIVTVGPDGRQPCRIRVEDLGAGYRHGAFIFLGPGFFPGAPSAGAGGSAGGPDGAK